jgi:transporter family-2 protein
MGMITATINAANGILAGKIGLLESVVVVHTIGLLMSIFYYIVLEKDKSKSYLNVLRNKPYLALGGFIGSFAVVSISYAVQSIGVFIVSTALVVGQFVMSFIIDSQGLFGFRKQPLTKKKLLSITIMIVGVIFLSL